MAIKPPGRVERAVLVGNASLRIRVEGESTLRGASSVLHYETGSLGPLAFGSGRDGGDVAHYDRMPAAPVVIEVQTAAGRSGRASAVLEPRVTTDVTVHIR